MAGSLDNLEVAGQWGAPTATNPSAAWWNPAGLAGGDGIEVLVVGEPTRAVMTFDRDAPNAGSAVYTMQGVLPFAGLAARISDTGLGLGAAIAVPLARGGAIDDPDAVSRYHLQTGSIQTIHGILGAGYEWRDVVAVGAALHLIDSRWASVLDVDGMVDLGDAMVESGAEQPYTDSDLENPRYATELDFGVLTDTAMTWSVGMRLVPHDKWSLGVAHIRPYSVDNQGTATLGFDCPPNDGSDPDGRMGAEVFGVCDTTLQANASVAYDLPARWHFGVESGPWGRVSIQALGGWAGWSAYEDFDITISGAEDLNEFATDEQASLTPKLVNQSRLWARASKDSWFFGLGARSELPWVDNRFTLGVRALFDRAAVPDYALSPNNYDADTLSLSSLFQARLTERLHVGLGFGHAFVQTRTSSDNAFSMTIDPSERAEDRFSYPHANGTYGSSINRAQLAVKVNL